MNATGRTMSSVLDLLPAPVIRRAARRYLGGATVSEAMDVARALAAEGMPATLAVVGEAAGRRSTPAGTCVSCSPWSRPSAAPALTCAWP